MSEPKLELERESEHLTMEGHNWWEKGTDAYLSTTSQVEGAHEPLLRHFKNIFRMGIGLDLPCQKLADG